MIEEERAIRPFAEKSVGGKSAGKNSSQGSQRGPSESGFLLRLFHPEHTSREETPQGIGRGNGTGNCVWERGAIPAPKITDGKPGGVKLPNVANRASGGCSQNVRESLSVGISHFTDYGSWLISAEFESRCCFQRSLCWRVMVACAAG